AIVARQGTPEGSRAEGVHERRGAGVFTGLRRIAGQQLRERSHGARRERLSRSVESAAEERADDLRAVVREALLRGGRREGVGGGGGGAEQRGHGVVVLDVVHQTDVRRDERCRPRRAAVYASIRAGTAVYAARAAAGLA